MADCDDISISRLVGGWLDQLETEAINELKDARLYARAAPAQFAQYRLKYAEYQLATIRKVRQRIPKAWNKATVDLE